VVDVMNHCYISLSDKPCLKFKFRSDSCSQKCRDTIYIHVSFRLRIVCCTYEFTDMISLLCHLTISGWFCHLYVMWARECCRISPRCFLAKCRKRELNKGSFVLLCFVLFAFSGLCLVSVFLIYLLSCTF